MSAKPMSHGFLYKQQQQPMAGRGWCYWLRHIERAFDACHNAGF